MPFTEARFMASTTPPDLFDVFNQTFNIEAFKEENLDIVMQGPTPVVGISIGKNEHIPFHHVQMSRISLPATPTTRDVWAVMRSQVIKLTEFVTESLKNQELWPLKPLYLLNPPGIQCQASLSTKGEVLVDVWAKLAAAGWINPLDKTVSIKDAFVCNWRRRED